MSLWQGKDQRYKVERMFLWYLSANFDSIEARLGQKYKDLKLEKQVSLF